MKIIKKQVLAGPNVWSTYRKKLIQLKLDLEEMEAFPTDKLPGFSEKLKKILPGLIEHECSEGKKGGFYQRLERGTWLGHVMEHVALELQTRAGMDVGYGRTRETITKGVYNMVFTYEIAEAGLYAADAAFRLVDALSRNLDYDPMPDIEELMYLKQRYGLGPSTKSIVVEAEKRGIPWRRLGGDSRIQFGYGKNQARIQATMTCRTSATAVDIASNKVDTKRILSAGHIPVPEGDICADEEKLSEIIEEIDFPIVIKPLDGNQGKGATTNINCIEEAKMAFKHAQEFSDYVVVEKYIEGSDFRLLVIGGKFAAASKRIPACVIGDGILTIRELIEVVNKDPKRGDGHEAELTKIKFDHDTFLQLEKYGYTMESIPPADETVYLKSTANLSTGGTAIDVTDDVCPENRLLAERAAAFIGLDICGIDLMAPTISSPLNEIGGAILEVNAAPGFRMHLSPSYGKPRNVGKAVIDMLYPEGTESRIPIFAVTGTNGKTTTSRLLAHIAKKAGYNVGYTTTDGIYIGDQKICDGDTTGPVSAATVLCDPTVDFAVLETARGGLLRNGLAFDYSDVGIITNIREDHLGLNDIHTLADLAKVKSVVVRTVKETGWAVLNGDDEHCVAIAAELDCNVAFFTTNPKNEVVQSHIAKEGCAIILEGKEIIIYYDGEKTSVANVARIPLTDNGKAVFMVENVLAACAAAFMGGLGLITIREALKSFIPCFELTPGRMNLFDMGDFKVLVDYAHNPHGINAIKNYIESLKVAKKIGIISGVGDRRDEDITGFASIAGCMFDHIIVRQEHDLRGRTEEEINALILKGLNAVCPDIKIDFIADEAEAFRHALSLAQKGDLIVALSDQYKKVVEIIKEKKAGNAAQPLSLQPDINGPLAS